MSSVSLLVMALSDCSLERPADSLIGPRLLFVDVILLEAGAASDKRPSCRPLASWFAFDSDDGASGFLSPSLEMAFSLLS